MFAMTEETQRQNALRVFDYDLPLLATEAAIDIDNLLSSRSNDVTTIRLLAEKLRNSIEISASGEPIRSLMDPTTLTILDEAVAQTADPGYSRKVEDLLAAAVQIASELSSDDPTKNKRELERARDFCIALSTAVVAYHKSIIALEV